MHCIGGLLKELLIFFLCLYTSVVVAQVNSDGTDEKFSAVSFGMDFMTNSSLNGRFSMLGSQPTLTNMTSYYHKWGFDVSAMYSNVWKSDESNKHSTQELGLSLGYSQDITEWLSSSASYSQFYYSRESHSLRSIYKHLMSAGLYSEVDWWVTDMMLGYYSGKGNELFVAFETGASINFDNVLKKGNSLSIQPMISAYMGDINYYNSEAYQNYFLYNTAKKFPNATVEDYIKIQEKRILSEETDAITDIRIQKKIDKAELLPSGVVLWDLFKEQQSFDFNNIGFTIPIYYYCGDFVLNLGFSAFRPVNQPSYVDEEWSGYTNLGLTYFMSW